MKSIWVGNLEQFTVTGMTAQNIHVLLSIPHFPTEASNPTSWGQEIAYSSVPLPLPSFISGSLFTGDFESAVIAQTHELKAVVTARLHVRKRHDVVKEINT